MNKWFTGVTTVEELRKKYRECQLYILKRIIRQKHINKQYFDDMLYYAFGCKNYRQLSYSKMYRLIYVLNCMEAKKSNIN